MKTTACILLLAAAVWAQQVAVPQGGSLGPSCNLSDAATLGADKVDGSHASATPGANTVPVTDSNGKLAPGWLPLPTASSIGGIFMDADCLAGNHVTGIDAATGRLRCSADAAEWGNIGNKPSVFPPDTGSQAWLELLAAVALKAPLADAALSGITTAENIVVSASLQVGSGPAAVNFAYLGAADSDPSGSCTPGVIWKATSANGTKQFRCVAGVWAEDTVATSVLGDPGANGVVKRTAQNSTAVAGYADIVASWTSCTGNYLRKDGTCDDPAGGEVTPALSEDSTAVSSTKKIVAPEFGGNASQAALLEGGETTPGQAGTGTDRIEFNSTTHRPSFSSTNGSGGVIQAPTDVVVQADAAAASAANALVKANASGLLDSSWFDFGTGAGQVAEGAALALKAPLNSPALTGTPTAPTPAADNNSTQIATTAYTRNYIASLPVTESSPSVTEDASNVNSSKPIAISGAQAKIEGSEGTAAVAASGKGMLSFNSATHRPAYSYNGGAAQDVMLAGEGGTGNVVSAETSANGELAVFTASSDGKHIAKSGGTGFVKVANGVPTAGAIAASDLPAALSSSTSINGVAVTAGKTLMYTDSSVAASQLPNPGAASKGGVQAKTCTGTDKLSAIGTDGVPVCSTDATGGAGSSLFAWYSPGTGSTGALVNQPVTQNATLLWGMVVNGSITTSGFCYHVQTMDNTANVYDIGIYDSSGTLLVHTGALAGTALFPSAGTRCSSWAASGTVSGKVYLALTGSAASPAAKLGGATTAMPQFANGVAPSAGGTTSGGALNATITPPSDNWIASGTLPNLVLR